MPLSAGTRLGPYEVRGPIGAGGMGEVYRARDTRLGRDVAVKVLPAEASHTPERLHRFEQEARLAGSLNHPNVLTLFDVGILEGTPYLVTELLEGRTLREVLEAGPLATRKVVEHAQQIARGLAAAHERGVVHRDLKPANLFVTKDGRVKVLDFGLAKLTQPLPGEGSQCPTETAEGHVVGTIAYMSPEQVRGQAVDARSDVFALGAVVYEMLTGRRAFTGDTPADTMTAILTKDPEELSRPGFEIPVGLERIVRRCLEKDPAERFQSAKDVAFALEAESGTSHGAAAEVPALPRRRGRGWAVTAAVGLVATATGAWVSHRFGPRPSPPPHLLQLTFGHGITQPARFTADGHTIVFTAYWNGRPPEILSRRLDQEENVSLGLPPARLLSVSSRGELAILLTPPHESGLTDVGTLSRVPLSGGTVRPLLEDVADADWSPDGQDLAVVRGRDGRAQLEFPVGHVLHRAGSIQFLRVSPRGDRVAMRADGRLVLVDREAKASRIDLGPERTGADFYGVTWSPDGESLLVTLQNPSMGFRTLRRVALDGTVTELYAAPGHIVVEDVARDGRVLLHHGFERVGVRGKPPGALEEREIEGSGAGAVAHGLSDDGTRVLTSGNALASLTGEPSMRLAEQHGWGVGLSGDARWAVFLAGPADYSRLVLAPMGPGEPVRFDTPQLKNGRESGAGWALMGMTWQVDGGRVGFNGAEPGRPPRAFLFERSTGRSRPVTPEGAVAVHGLAPDDHVLACAEDGSLAFYPLAGGEAQPVRARLSNILARQVVRVSGDGRFLFLKEGNVPARIERLELLTGRRTPWKTLRPADPSGVYQTWTPRLTPDGAGYAYAYGRALNDVYLLEGLRF
jgi:eukaryotic-like serine/threonine-protein kinase